MLRIHPRNFAKPAAALAASGADSVVETDRGKNNFNTNCYSDNV
jgi:hypothetical protein